MYALGVSYPAVEYPKYIYNEDKYRVMTMPLKEFPKNAPELRDIQFKRPIVNDKIVMSLNRYLENSSDVDKHATRMRPYNPQKFERTREQSEAIFFLSIYSIGLILIMVMWYILFMR